MDATVLGKSSISMMACSIEYNPLSLQAIVREALIVLKAIAGNDEVKVAIVKSNGVELILLCMSKHIKHAGVGMNGEVK